MKSAHSHSMVVGALFWSQTSDGAHPLEDGEWLNCPLFFPL